MRSWIVSKKTLFGVLVVVAALAASPTIAQAQVEIPSQVSFQGTGLVTKDSKDQVPSNEVTKSGGFLLGYSYQFNPWLGAEANYGYTRNTQNYIALARPTSLQTDFPEVTGALVVHIAASVPRLRPYAVAGGGALVFNPTDKFVVAGADRQTRGAFLYGGGADIDITNRFGVRAEYRGLVYKVPDFTLSGLDLDKVTHLAQPSVGFYFRF